MIIKCLLQDNRTQTTVYLIYQTIAPFLVPPFDVAFPTIRAWHAAARNAVPTPSSRHLALWLVRFVRLKPAGEHGWFQPNVDVDLAAALVGVLPQPVEIKAIIFICIKARLPVVAPLGDVQRGVWQSQAGAA